MTRATGSFTLSTRGEDGEAPRTAQVALSEGFAERYELAEQLGAGSMGAVYAGIQRSTGRPVAIKLLLIPDEADALARFMLEGRLLARIAHPAVLRVYDAGDEGGHPYLVTDLLTGGNLHERLESQPVAPLGETFAIIMRILEGLAACHDAGIIHRDLKPANVLFDAHGEAVVADLGISRLSDASMRLTQTGHRLGTPVYMSPEQWRGEEPTLATDIYAAGVMLHEMLAGRRPFVPVSWADLERMHLQQEPPPLDDVAGLPPGVAQVVARAMAKRPADRWASAHEMLAALRAALRNAEQEPAPGAAPGRKEPGRRPSRRVPAHSGGTRQPAQADALDPRRASGGNAESASTPYPRLLRGGGIVGLLAIATALVLMALRPPVGPRVVPPTLLPVRQSATPAAPPPESALQLDRYRPLPAGARYRVGDTWLRHASLRAVALSRDGTLLAVASGPSVVIWDLPARKVRTRIAVGTGANRVVFARGDTAIAATANRTLEDGEDADIDEEEARLRRKTPCLGVFDIASGRSLMVDEGGQARLCQPSGALAPCVRIDGTGSVMSLDGKPARPLPLPADLDDLKISANGTVLLARSKLRFHVLEAATGTVRGQFDVESIAETFAGFSRRAVAISDDGTRAAVALRDGVRLVELPTGRTVRTFPIAGCHTLTLSPGARTLALSIVPDDRGGSSYTAAVNVETGAQVRLDADFGITAWSADGRVLAVASSSGSVRVFDARTFQPDPHTPGSWHARVKRIARDARHMLVNGPGSVAFADLTAGTRTPLELTPPTVVDLETFSADGRHMAFADLHDHRGKVDVMLADTATGRVTGRWESPRLISLALSTDADAIACLRDEYLSFRDAASGASRERLPLANVRGRDLSFDPTLRYIGVQRAGPPAFTTPRGLTAQLARDDNVLLALSSRRHVLAYASAGDAAVVDGSGADALSVLTVPAATLRCTLAGSRRPRSSAFSTDGTWVAAGYDDGRIEIWDAATGMRVRRFDAGVEPAIEIALDREQGRMVTRTVDEAAVVWDLSKGQ